MNYHLKLLTRKDVEQILQIGSTKSYQIFSSKDFPTIKIGRILRVREDEFYKWMERHEVNICA